MVTGFSQGITAAQAFVRIGVEDKVSAALAVIQGKLNQFAANVGRIGTELQKIALGGGIFGSGLIYGLKKATEESSRATEVNTAYAATFRELTGAASEFADTLARKFKRDVVDVKDIQRSFFGLFTGQGFQRGFSLKVADVFTQLSFDFGSFFNQTVEEASGRLLSALSNSAEVVQRFGFNVRVDSLERAFSQLGIDKTVEQASEAEKLIARVLVLLQTSSKAQLNIFGDVERTIDEFANQTRGLGSAVQIFLRSIGRPFEQALAPIIGGLAKATTNAAAWVSQNPKFVTQIGFLTTALVAGSGALLTFGFGIRLAAFSLGPFVKLMAAPILVLAKLFDVIGFGLTTLFHFSRFFGTVIPAAISATLGPLQIMSNVFGWLFRRVSLATGGISLFGRIIGSIPWTRITAWVNGLGTAFWRGFNYISFATRVAGRAGSSIGGMAGQVATGLGHMSSSMNGLIRTGTTGMTVVGGFTQRVRGLLGQTSAIGNFFRAFSTPPIGFLEGPMKGMKEVNAWLKGMRNKKDSTLPSVSTGSAMAVRKVYEGVVESASNMSKRMADAIDVQFTVYRTRLQQFMDSTANGLRRIGSMFSSLFTGIFSFLANGFRAMAGASAAAFSSMASAIRHPIQSFQVLRQTAIKTLSSIRFAAAYTGQSIKAGMAYAGGAMLEFAKVAVRASMIFIRSFLMASATALAPLLAKIAILSAIAATLGGVFMLFKDQIVSAFSSVMKAVGKFAENAKASLFGFLTTAKNVFFDVLDFAKEQFFQLLDIGKYTFEALNNAIIAGDFRLAFQVAFAGAKVAFFNFAFAAVDRWGTTIESMISGLLNLKFWFQRVFREITGFAETAFETMESARQKTVNSISRGIIAGLVKIGAVDAAVMQTLEEDIARQRKSREDAIAAKTAADLLKIEEARKAALAGVGDGVAAFRNNLGASLTASQQELAALAGQAMAAANPGQMGGDVGQLIDPEGFMAQIQNQSMAGFKGSVDAVRQSLEGMDVRSSQGQKLFADAVNNRNPNQGVEDRLAMIENRLVNDVPQAMGEAVGDAINAADGVIGLPNQARN